MSPTIEKDRLEAFGDGLRTKRRLARNLADSTDEERVSFIRAQVSYLSKSINCAGRGASSSFTLRSHLLITDRSSKLRF